MDRLDDPLGRKLEPPRDRVDDPGVRLVADQEGDVLAGEPEFCQQVLGSVGGVADGEAEDRLALLLQEVLFPVHRLVGRWAHAAPRRHLEQVAPRAVHLVVEPENAFAVLGGFKQDRPPGVPEEDAGGAVFVVGDRAHHVGPDDQRPFHGSAGDELGSGGEGEVETAAGR